MANIKQAVKRVGTSQTSRAQNQMTKSTMRSKIKQVEHLVEANDNEQAVKALQDATKAIDKAVQKGTVHKNNGSREKSRLAKKVNGIGA